MIDHVGINCADYAESQRFYDAVLATLGFSRPGYFGAFVRDPDGNNVEAVFHGTLP